MIKWNFKNRLVKDKSKHVNNLPYDVQLQIPRQVFSFPKKRVPSMGYILHFSVGQDIFISIKNPNWYQIWLTDTNNQERQFAAYMCWHCVISLVVWSITIVRTVFTCRSAAKCHAWNSFIVKLLKKTYIRNKCRICPPVISAGLPDKSSMASGTSPSYLGKLNWSWARRVTVVNEGINRIYLRLTI